MGLNCDVVHYLSADVQHTLNSLSERLGPNHDLATRWAAEPTLLRFADKQGISQSWWSDQIAQMRCSQLRHMGTARDQVRIASQEGTLASAWLSVTPSRQANTTLSDTDFRSLCRYWLGLPLMPDGITRSCPLCSEAVDPFGDHFVNCRKNGRTRRHNAVRDCWSNLLTSASISHIREAPSTTGQRPADLLLLAWDKGRDIAVDFTITNP